MMNLLKPIRVVRAWDPAIDFHAMGRDGMKAYADTRDEAMLKFLPGKQPTWFHIRSLPRSYCAFVRGTDNLSAQRARAFCYGVIKVENLTGRDGQHRRLWEPVQRDQLGGFVWSDDELDLISENAIEEIGAVISQRSFLCPDSDEHYALPPTSRVALEAMLSRPAEPSAINAPLSSSDPKAPPADAATSTPAESGASTTAASATESHIDHVAS